MRRGTTPTHKFIIPFESTDLENVQIVYKQYNKILIEKHTEDITIIPSNDGFTTTLQITLTQEETFRFDVRQKALIQIRILTDNDIAISSKVISLNIEYSLDENILEDE